MIETAALLSRAKNGAAEAAASNQGKKGSVTDMKHAVIAAGAENNDAGKYVAAGLTEGRTVRLAEAEYTQEALERFRSEQSQWILRCAGDRYFLADSDSGEDAHGYYCGYFDLRPETAVFDRGELVGVYISTDGIRYSGNGRSSFEITKWGYPEEDPFRFIPWGGEVHVFLFSDAATHKWGEWTLLKREPGAEYRSCLEF